MTKAQQMLDIVGQAYRNGKAHGFRKAYDRLAGHIDTYKAENRELRKCQEKQAEALKDLCRYLESIECQYAAESIDLIREDKPLSSRFHEGAAHGIQFCLATIRERLKP